MHHIHRPLALVLIAIREHPHPKTVSSPIGNRELDTGDLMGAKVAIFTYVESAVFVLVFAFVEEGERMR